MQLASLDHVQGLARRFPFFQPVSLKRGSVDPKRDLPPQDIQLLATTANLVVRDELHPALAYLLLEAARQVHRQPSLINRPGEFPSPTRHRFPAVDRGRALLQERPPVPAELPAVLGRELRAAAAAAAGAAGGDPGAAGARAAGADRLAAPAAGCTAAMANSSSSSRTWPRASSTTRSGARPGRSSTGSRRRSSRPSSRSISPTGSTRCASMSTMCGRSCSGRASRTRRTESDGSWSDSGRFSQTRRGLPA